MATVSKPERQNLAQDHQRVRSPLQALRGYIRSYVTLEGAALCGLYLALWFWVGMVLDYGVFRLTALDWVDVLPWGLRLGVLIVLVSGLLATGAFVVVSRFLREFSDAAVALVLERRFPKLLGDRLITAVELSDPQQAEAYGYSAAMVKETIHEAAHRVAQVPVREVFDWKRLWMRGLLVVLTTLGIYLVCWGGVAAVRAVSSGPLRPEGGLTQLNTVSSLWFERNILLRDVLWPRQTRLEVVNYRDNERVAKDKTLPALRVRAWKYVIADRGTREGWRLLTWDDVGERAALFGAYVKAPEVWAPRDRERGLTADEVELWLNRFPFKKRGDGEGLPARWNIADEGATQEEGAELRQRALRWSDLTPDRLGKFPVPQLPAGEWDPLAYPMEAASLVSALAGQSLAPMVGVPGPALTRVMVGPQEVSLTVDVVEKQIPLRQKALPGPTKTALARRVALVKGLTDSLSAELAPRDAFAAALAQWENKPDRSTLRQKMEVALLAAQGKRADKEKAKAEAREAVAGFLATWDRSGLAEVESESKDLLRQSEQLTAVEMVFVHLTRYLELRETMNGVVARVGDAAHSRLLRKLVLPEQLELVYHAGKKDRKTNTMQRAGNNEYTGNFGTLQESVTFWARGGDYKTAEQTITVVENPKVDLLRSEEERPAYVYYRVADGQASELRGKRQAFNEVLLSVTAPDGSHAEVLAGTSLTLTAKTNKPIKSATLSTVLKVGAGKAHDLPVWGWARQMKSVSISASGKPVPGVKAAVGEVGHVVVLSVDDVAKEHQFKLSYVTAKGGVARSSMVSLAPSRGADKRVVGVEVTYDLELGENNSHLPIRIENVQQELAMTVAFVDEDNVPGSRVIRVTPVRDQAPAIREFSVDESVRTSKEGHVVTAKARLPFRARVQDDLGLARVRYAYTADRDDLKRKRKENEVFVRLGGVVLPTQGPATFWASAAALAAPYEVVLTPKHVELPLFDRTIHARKTEADGRLEFLTLATIEGLLPKKQANPFRVLLRQFSVEPDEWSLEQPPPPPVPPELAKDANDRERRDYDKRLEEFEREVREYPKAWTKWYDLSERRVDCVLLAPLFEYYDRTEKAWKKVQETDERKAQPRYEVKVWLEVEDTFAEGELKADGQPRPNTSRSNETFTFLVVSENELLARIGEEEEKKRDELRKTYLPLDEKQKDMGKLVSDLGPRTLDEETVASLAVRAGTLDTETLASGQKVAKDVLAVYQRILREMRLNQVSDKLTKKVHLSIVEPLSKICDDGGNFDTTRAAVQALQKELEDTKKGLPQRLAQGELKAKNAQMEMELLVRRLNEVLSAMQGISDINDLINILVKIERDEEAQARGLQKVLGDEIDNLVNPKK